MENTSLWLFCPVKPIITQGQIIYLWLLCHRRDYTQARNFCQSFLKIFLPVFCVLCKFYDKILSLTDLNFKLGLSVEGDVQVLIGKGGDAPTPGRPGEEAQLHEIGLVHIL